MGNIYKLISGFILLVLGITLAYETTVNNFNDLLLLIGFIIAVFGIILIINYFINSSAIKTGDLIKEFIKEDDNSSLNFNSNGNQENIHNSKPLKVRSEFNDIGDEGSFYSREISKSPDYYEYDEYEYLDDEDDSYFGSQLKFTPNYDKPSKVTRTPRKREKNFLFENPEHMVNDFEISNAYEEPFQDNFEEFNPIVEESINVESTPDIKLDINNSESLPIPKSLKSFVISNNSNIITSQEAFEQLASNVNKEIMLEIPDLNELSDRFLSHIPTIYSRVIIEDFDVSDISYMILIASLLRQGVHIKTIPKINTINLITDDSHAMIISDNKIKDIEYGAIYNDRLGISEVRASFEKTWDIAKDLDENILLKYMGMGE